MAGVGGGQFQDRRKNRQLTTAYTKKDRIVQRLSKVGGWMYVAKCEPVARKTNTDSMPQRNTRPIIIRVCASSTVLYGSSGNILVTLA